MAYAIEILVGPEDSEHPILKNMVGYNPQLRWNIIAFYATKQLAEEEMEAFSHYWEIPLDRFRIQSGDLNWAIQGQLACGTWIDVHRAFDKESAIAYMDKARFVCQTIDKFRIRKVTHGT